MKITLEPYQQEAFEFLSQRDVGVLHGAIGAGKTPIALELISYLIDNLLSIRVLIIAPPAIVNNVYVQEIAKWDQYSHLTCSILHGPKKEEALRKNADIYLITYDADTLAWLFTHEHCPNFDVLLLDESHHIKDSSTSRFKVLKEVAPYFERRYLMTGTPMGNSYEDFWAQYYIADLGVTLLKSKNQFLRRWFYQVSRYYWRDTKDGKLEIPRRIAPITHVIPEDAIEKSAISRKAYYIDLPKSVMKLYKQMEKDACIELKGKKITAQNLQVVFQKTQQMSSGFVYSQEYKGAPRETSWLHDLKVKKLVEILEPVKEPVMLVAYYTEEFERLKQQYPDIAIINGKTSIKEQKRLVVEWNNGRIPLLAIHPFSIGEGVNLQAVGRIQIWLSLCWSSIRFRQTVGRLWRKGQKNKVLIRVILANGTIDEIMFTALQRHAKTSRELGAIIRSFQKKRGY